MPFFYRLFVVGAAVLLFAGTAAGAEPPPSEKSRQQSTRDLPISDIFSSQTSKVDVVGDSLEYDRPNKKIIARGNVTVHQGDEKISSDYAEVQTETKQVLAKGHVFTFHHDQPMAQGDVIYYDFGNKTASFPDGRILATPWFITGKDIRQIRKGVKVIHDGHITTCNYEKPHYDIRARKITIYDNDKIIAWNIKIVALGKTIFWWPYLSIPLHELRNAPLIVNAGYQSRFGTYIETSKGFSVNKNIHGKLHADWRSERGVGGGADLNYKYNRVGRGLIKTYLTNDKRAPTVGNADNPFRENEERLRGRVTWLHRTDFDDMTNMIFRYNRVEDEFFLQDFFYKEHRSEQEPQSFVTLTKNTEHFGVLTHVEKKMNKFESMVERLPEVRFDWKNQPFFMPWLYYDNQVSFANLNKTLSRTAADENAVRSDFFQEWSAPLHWHNIKLTPIVNFRMTDYSRIQDSSENRFRVVAGGGMDLRTHFYKTYPISFQKMGMEVNQIRHVVEPNFQYTRATSNVSDERLVNFDHIDRLDDADVFTAGIENRFQTKRVVGGRVQRVDLVSLNTYLSYEANPDNRVLGTQFSPYEDGNSRSRFTAFGQEVVLRPYEWLQYEARFDYDAGKTRFRVFNQDLVGTFWHRWKVVLGQRFINDFDFGDSIAGSDQYVLDTSYVINPLWTIGGYLRWDSKVNGRDEWQVSLVRDLHDFILDFGYNVRNSSIDSSNKTLYVNFYLKAFPIIGLHSGVGRSSFSPPRIGETVAGANVSSQANPSFPEGYY